jgi:hypothetical protein
MSLREKFGIAAIAMLFSARSLPAQDLLRVEVLSDANWNWELITVRIKNISAAPVELAVPVNESIRTRAISVNPLPMDVERHDRQSWSPCAPGGNYSIRLMKRKYLYPGETTQFKFALGGGSGEYRVRVWYFLNYGDPGPPWHPPQFGSTVSNTFQVVSQTSAAVLAERPLRLCGTIAWLR